jgi:leucyl-tRNA synthetase
MEYHAFATADSLLVSTADVVDITEEAGVEGSQLVGAVKSSGQKVAAKTVSADLVEKRGERYVLKSDPKIVVEARSFKMSKSRGNVINPDKIVDDYGADAFRLYEMYMGPLEAQKPWSTRDIVGMSRFLNAVYRNFVGDEEAKKTAQIVDAVIPQDIDRQLHRTIKKVGDDIAALRFNTAIAELIKLNNEMGRLATVPKQLADTFTLLLAPFAPHVAEEIWSRLGHERTLARHPWPEYDEAKLVETTLELPVQVNGKLRGTISVPADAGEAEILAAAQSTELVKPWLEGKTLAKRIYVPKKLVSFVVK